MPTILTYKSTERSGKLKIVVMNTYPYKIQSDNLCSRQISKQTKYNLVSLWIKIPLSWMWSPKGRKGEKVKIDVGHSWELQLD